MPECSSSPSLPTVLGAEQHAGAADAEFESFAAHRLDEHAELKFATTGDFETVLVFAFRNTDGDIGFRFAVKTIADHAAGDLAAFATGEGAVIDRELHGERGRIDRLRFDRGLYARICDGVRHRGFFQTRKSDDVARFGAIDRHAVEAIEAQQLRRAADFDHIAM